MNRTGNRPAEPDLRDFRCCRDDLGKQGVSSKKQQEVGRGLVRMLIDRGDRELAFTEAARWGVRKLVDKFLDEGIDVNWQTDDGVNALMLASFAGEHQIVKTLLEHGADVNTTCQKNRTALHDAVAGLVAEGKSKKVANLLLSAGADIHCKDNNEYTPADYARQRYSEEYVELLSTEK